MTELISSPYFLIPAVVLDVVFTGLAMWFSARRNNIPIFIMALVIQLFGIPELIYLLAIRYSKKLDK